MTNWQEQSQKASLALTLSKNGRGSISTLSGEPAGVQQIAASVKKLSAAFPQMSADFFNILAERIAKRRLSAQRLEYAIEQVIDNYTYQRLTIADIMSIDSRVEILSYAEMLNECYKRGCTSDEFTPIHIGQEPKPYWIHKIDKIRFNIPDKI